MRLSTLLFLISLLFVGSWLVAVNRWLSTCTERATKLEQEKTQSSRRLLHLLDEELNKESVG